MKIGFSLLALRAIVLGSGLVPLLAMAAADSEPNPIVAKAKAALKDPAKPFTLIVSLQVKDGMQEKFEAAFAKARKATHKEKGVLTYDLNRDVKEPTHYQVYERWKSLAALEDHLKTPHITTLLGELKEMLVAAPESRVLLPAGE